MTRSEQLGSVAAVVGKRYSAHDVPVRGGSLRVGVWEPEAGAVAGTVVAIHGITSSHLAWPLLAAAMPGVRVIAPDLRGRGRSNGLPAPYGMPSHAQDVAAAMEALGVDRAVVVGHSMGAFVALVLADRHPERVASLVLVDGGMPLLPPAGVSPDALAQAILGPTADRLAMTFPDRGTYQQFFRQHPAFARDWSDLVTAYVDYDLHGAEPFLRPATTVQALEADIRELVDGDSLLHALAHLRHEVVWLLAPRGLMDEEPPLYPDTAREHWVGEHPQLELAEIADVNHYTIVLSERGTNGVLPWVERALAG